jgi:uncharacterized membrane protein
MRLKHIDLIVPMIIAVLNMIVSLFSLHIPVVNIIFALPLVFVLPGYTLTKVVFYKRALNPSESLLFSLGLSIAIDILGGLFLNVLPIGLQAISWVTLLGLLTLTFSLLTFYLRVGVPITRIRLLRVHRTIYPGILLALAIAVTTISIVYAVYGASHQPHPGFTQLWALPESSPGKSSAVRVGIQSFESTPVTYRLTMTANGHLVTTWSSLSLAPQEEWGRLIPVPPSTSNDVSLDFRLYRGHEPGAVYQEVHLTFSNIRGGNVVRQNSVKHPDTNLRSVLAVSGGN